MRKFLFIVLFIISGTLVAQKINTTFKNSVALPCDTYLGFDTVGDTYYIKNNVLFKKSKTQLWQYQNLQLGKITSVDLLNPLQLVVFYEAFNSIVLLDNQLNEVYRIDLNQQESMVASHVAMSGRNKLWIYNSITQKLGLYDYIKKSYQSFPIPIQGKINYAQSDFNFFYWIDDINNLYSSTIFGKTELLANIPAFDQIQIIDNERVLFSVKNTLYLLHVTQKSIYEIDIVEKSFENFYYKDQILAIFTNQQIKNYQIKLP